MFDKLKKFFKIHKLDLQIIVICILVFIASDVNELNKGGESMATVQLPSIENANDLYQVKEQLAKLTKEIDYLLNNLDSTNVTSINTNRTKVSSKDGSTIIDGNQLVMTDTTTPRLKMGYNETSGLFEFILYDENGIKTFEVDSTGEAIFKGSISTEKNAIIGNKITLGDPDAVGVIKTIEINANALISTQDKNFTVANYLGDGKLILSGGANQNGAGVVVGETGQRLGFYGKGPISKQTLYYGNSAEANAIITALANLGLVNAQ